VEFIIHWFWLIYLFKLILVAYVIYKAILYKLKNTFWNIVAIVVFMVSLVSPFKIQPTTDSVNKIQNIQIENTKELPEIVKDDSFKNTRVMGITDEDLK